MARTTKSVTAVNPAPTVEFVDEYNSEYDKNQFADANPTNADTAVSIKVPNISITDNNGKEDLSIEVKCVYTGSTTVDDPTWGKITINNGVMTGGNENRFYYDEASGCYIVKATYTGTYTTTFTVTENGASPVTKEWSVAVGDVQKPEFFIQDADTKKEVLHTEVKTGDTYILDSETLKDYITDDKSTWDKIKVNLTMTNSSNNAVENVAQNATDAKHKKFQATLSESGKYTLTITVTDDIGNYQVYTETITVSDETADTNNVGTIVGTVLIVISSLVLVGVVAYFIISAYRKKKGKKSRSRKNK